MYACVCMHACIHVYMYACRYIPWTDPARRQREQKHCQPSAAPVPLAPGLHVHRCVGACVAAHHFAMRADRHKIRSHAHMRCIGNDDTLMHRITSLASTHTSPRPACMHRKAADTCVGVGTATECNGHDPRACTASPPTHLRSNAQRHTATHSNTQRHAGHQ